MNGTDTLTEKQALDEIESWDWWRGSGRREFSDLLRELVGHGLSPDAALDVLSRARYIVGNEYGD